MKLVFQVEDQSDFAVLSILVRRILDFSIEPIYRERRTNGVAAVKATLEGAAWDAWTRGADGLVIVIDNDGCTPVHEAAHEGQVKPKANAGCNYCQLMTILPTLPPRPPTASLKFAIGVAVQALESWLLFGAHLSGGKREHQPEKIDRSLLKRKLYGTNRLPRRQRETICKPIAEKIDLNGLSQACPSFLFFRDSILKLKS